MGRFTVSRFLSRAGLGRTQPLVVVPTGAGSSHRERAGAERRRNDLAPPSFQTLDISADQTGLPGRVRTPWSVRHVRPGRAPVAPCRPGRFIPGPRYSHWRNASGMSSGIMSR